MDISNFDKLNNIDKFNNMSNPNKLNDKLILDELHNLEENFNKKIEHIDAKLDLILNILNLNTNVCNKMGSHIDFIEDTYTQLKRPLFFFKNKIEQIIGTDQKTIEPIKN